jgi:hypothetical protein
MSCRSAAKRSRSSLTASSADMWRAWSSSPAMSHAHNGPSIVQIVKASSPNGNSAAYSNSSSPETKLTTAPRTGAMQAAAMMSHCLALARRYTAVIATIIDGASAHSPYCPKANMITPSTTAHVLPTISHPRGKARTAASGVILSLRLSNTVHATTATASVAPQAARAQTGTLESSSQLRKKMIRRTAAVPGTAHHV